MIDYWTHRFDIFGLRGRAADRTDEHNDEEDNSEDEADRRKKKRRDDEDEDERDEEERSASLAEQIVAADRKRKGLAPASNAAESIAAAVDAENAAAQAFINGQRRARGLPVEASAEATARAIIAASRKARGL